MAPNTPRPSHTLNTLCKELPALDTHDLCGSSTSCFWGRSQTRESKGFKNQGGRSGVWTGLLCHQSPAFYSVEILWNVTTVEKGERKSSGPQSTTWTGLGRDHSCRHLWRWCCQQQPCGIHCELWRCSITLSFLRGPVGVSAFFLLAVQIILFNQKNNFSTLVVISCVTIWLYFFFHISC